MLVSDGNLVNVCVGRVVGLRVVRLVRANVAALQSLGEGNGGTAHEQSQHFAKHLY
jgi:hypothetical protein